MTIRWMPVFGKFEPEGPNVTFHGEARPAPPGQGPLAVPAGEPVPSSPSIGVCISDQPTQDGTISAEVVFTSVGPEAVCEIVLAHDAETKGMLTAGLGGGWSMFAIRRWLPASGTVDQSRWETLDGSGDRVNLVPHRPYRLQLQTFGSRLRLSVDGVDVVAAQLREPLPTQAQVGLFCMGYSDTIIREFTVDSERAKVFVVMQFSSPFNEIYTDVIRRACLEHGLEPIRADEIYGPGLIIQDIVEQITGSHVVIADITPANQNVYFEVGFAHALNKPIILLAERGTKLPFDLAGARTLFYENSIGGRDKFDEGLRKHLSAIVGRPR